MKVIARFFWVLLIAVLLMMIACPTPTPTPTPTPEKITKEVIFGMVMPLSGPAASWGTIMLNTTDLIFNQVNKAGGLKVGDTYYEFKTIAYDNKFDPAQSVTLVKRVIEQDKASHVFPLDDPAYQATKDYLRDQGSLVFFVGWGPGVDPEYPLAFQMILPGQVSIRLAYEQITKLYPGKTRVALIGADDIAVHFNFDFIKEIAPQLGLEVVAEEYYPSGSTEIGGVMARVLAAKPDIMEARSSQGDINLCLKASNEQGWHGIRIYSAPVDVGSMLSVAGPEAAEDYIVGNAPDDKLPPGLVQLQKDYVAKYGGEFPALAADMAHISQVFIEAIRLAGSDDPEAMAEVLRTKELNTVWGPIKAWGAQEQWVGINNYIAHPIPLSVIKDGKLQFIGWFTP